MIFKCRFCEFKRESPVNLKTFEKVVKAFQDMIWEDMEAYAREMYEESGFSAWRGVKIHMGKKHPADAYYGMWPDKEMDAAETAVMKRILK